MMDEFLGGEKYNVGGNKRPSRKHERLTIGYLFPVIKRKVVS